MYGMGVWGRGARAEITWRFFLLNTVVSGFFVLNEILSRTQNFHLKRKERKEGKKLVNISAWNNSVLTWNAAEFFI